MRTGSREGGGVECRFREPRVLWGRGGGLIRGVAGRPYVWTLWWYETVCPDGELVLSASSSSPTPSSSNSSFTLLCVKSGTGSCGTRGHLQRHPCWAHSALHSCGSSASVLQRRETRAHVSREVYGRYERTLSANSFGSAATMSICTAGASRLWTSAILSRGIVSKSLYTSSVRCQRGITTSLGRNATVCAHLRVRVRTIGRRQRLLLRPHPRTHR